MSLLAIGVFVAGPPVAAVVTAGWWRQHVPRRGQVWHFLTSTDESLDVKPVLAGLLVLVLVALWVVLATLLVRDLVAALARRGPVQRRLRLPAPLHTLVTAAAGAAAITVTTGAAHATPPPASAGIVATQPATPTPAGAPLAARTVSTTAAPVYQVREGDWLWHVADRFLGDPLRYPDITALNPDHRRQHAGFPDHIEPGWRLHLPADARDRGPRRHATGTLATPPTTKPPAPPSAPATPPAVPEPSPSTATTAPASAPPATATPRDRREAAHGVNLGRYGWLTGPVAAAIAAASTLVWLRRRRSYQPRPPTGIRRADPDLIAPAPAIAALPAAAPAHSSAAAADGGAVGVDGDRLLALTELPAGGAGLSGPGTPDAARGLLVAALAAGGEDATVLTTTGDLDLLLPAGKALRALEALRVVDNLTDALTVLEQELLRRSRTIAETDDDADDQAITPAPLLLLTAAPEATAGTRLAAILAVGSRLGIHAVLLGSWPSGPTWHVAADGTVRAGEQAPATAARLNILTADATVDVLDTLALASIVEDDTAQPPPLPRLASTTVEPAEPETPEADALAEPVADGQHGGTVGRLRLTLLGPPTVTVTDHTGQSDEVYIRRSDSLHVLYYLAVEPRGGTIDEIMEALYPEERRTPARRKFHTSASELRNTLRDATGADLILKTNNRYRLDRRHVDVDLWRLHAAIDAAANAVDPDTEQQHLREAVEAYAGPLADGDDRHWLTVPREALRRHIIDAYTRLADHHTDPAAALTLIQDAIRVDPYNEPLYQRAIVLHGTLGNADGIHTTLRTLTERLRELRTPISQRTKHLAAERIAAIQGRR
ncbi:hypothetical protein Pa4123_89770 [Phytohabitans aurantiacus]|uniref:Bacterial transcriptional activator domain-containing protein n=1 Tax=Phytohabitans aurantiacus TaxID=3016789 RepID=A0ABQ5RAT6_9ACTN|nr:hypothetical protein Pa4123_89770 [Phytohabitans aurantiacus]